MDNIDDDIIITALEVAYQALRDPDIREAILDKLDISDEFGDDILEKLTQRLELRQ